MKTGKRIIKSKMKTKNNNKPTTRTTNSRTDGVCLHFLVYTIMTCIYYTHTHTKNNTPDRCRRLFGMSMRVMVVKQLKIIIFIYYL